jgi:nucleoside-diphosphate kinase
MAVERTLSIIKPDAVAKNVIGQIYARFEGAGLKVVAAKMAHLSRGEAEAFYAVHKARPFFNDLVNFMISGPVMIQALEGEGAIAKNRELMGATDPKKADKGTIRADFADSIDANAVHGSDAPETAAVEVAFFFPGMNVYSAEAGARAARTHGRQSARLRPRGAGGILRVAWARSAFAPFSCSAGSTRRAKPTSRMSDLAKSLRDKLAGAEVRARCRC